MKKYKFLVLLTVLALILAACGTPATKAPVASEPQPVVTEAPVVAEPPATEAKPIVVAIWSGPEHDNLVKVAEEYKKATGKEVIVEEVAREAYFEN